MHITPNRLQSERRLGGDTPYGLYDITVFRDHDGPIFDAAGKPLGTLKMVMRTPKPAPPKVLTEEQKARVADRQAVCDGCGSRIEFGTDAANGVVAVKCGQKKPCCNRLSLTSEKEACPLDKWPPIPTL